MTTFIIRPAIIDDSPALAQIQVDSYRTAYAGIMPEEYLAQFTYQEQEQNWCELLSNNMSDVLLVAERPGGLLAGYALGRPGQTSLTGYDGELVALHVRRSEQGQGAGRRLVVALARQLQQRGCRAMMLWVLVDNQRAQAFYRRLDGRLLDASQTTSTGTVEVAYGWSDIGLLVRLKV